MKRILAFLALCLTLLGTAVGAAACGSSDGAAANGPTRTIVDMAGRKVTIPVQVNRIGSNYPAMQQTLFMLGAADRMVAITTKAAQFSPLLATMYPRLTKIAAPFSEGENPDVEAVAATRPDLVFLSPAGKAFIPELQRVGIPAVVVAAFKDPAALKAGVRLVGGVLGGKAVQRANQFVDYYDNNVRRISSATKDIPQDKRPTVYYTAGEALQTEGKNSIVSSWISQAGGRNVAELHGISAPPTFASLSPEQVLGWNPDVIVCREPKTATEIRSDARWRNVKAVREGKVFVSPRGVFIWSVRSAEAALMPLWTAKMIHPDRFADLNLTDEIKQFYQRFYGYALSDTQVQEVLRPRAS